MTDKTWADEYLQMVEDCEKRESRLTEWEQGFISSISDWLESGRHPTPRQLDTLNDIWERATKNG